jgi:hypothetical protein
MSQKSDGFRTRAHTSERSANDVSDSGLKRKLLDIAKLAHWLTW